MNIDPPEKNSGEVALADWLELVATLSGDRAANLDLIADAADIAEDTEIDDIADDDAANEALIEAVTEEIRRRARVLHEAAYPFRMSANGEVLHLKNDLTYGQDAYLACLVINHSWTSGKLLAPTKLTDAEAREARNHFEILTAVAAIGIANGPAFLLGTNRRGAAGLLQRVSEICAHVGEGRARAALDPAAPARANDDSVDVLAVETENDGPPHRSFWFCQSAAGANFDSKPIINEIEKFMEIWMEVRPAHTNGALFFPAIVDDNFLRYNTRRLGQMYHRLRLPLQAQRGFELLAADAALLHYVDDVNAPKVWLSTYLARAGRGVAL